MPDFVIWTAAIIAALVIGAALVYILGFIASMIGIFFYELFEGADYAVHHAHMPNWHMPHHHGPAPTG